MEGVFCLCEKKSRDQEPWGGFGEKQAVRLIELDSDTQGCLGMGARLMLGSKFGCNFLTSTTSPWLLLIQDIQGPPVGIDEGVQDVRNVFQVSEVAGGRFSYYRKQLTLTLP